MIHVGISAPLIRFGTEWTHTYSHVSQLNFYILCLNLATKTPLKLCCQMAMNTNKKLPMFVNRKTKYQNVENTFSPCSHDISDNVLDQQTLLPARLKALSFRKITKTQLRKSIKWFYLQRLVSSWPPEPKPSISPTTRWPSAYWRTCSQQ